MRDAQRRFLEEGDTVVEGRDIGAVVWPESELKVWLDADPVERARRRSDESGDAARPRRRCTARPARRSSRRSARRRGARRLDRAECRRGHRPHRRARAGARRTCCSDRVPAHREEFGFWTPDRTWMAFKHTFGPPFRLAFRIRAYGTRARATRRARSCSRRTTCPRGTRSCTAPCSTAPIRWMAKTELFEVQPRARAASSRHGGVFTVRRGAGDIDAVRAARDVLREGSLLGMFVEGTRQPTEEVGDGEARDDDDRAGRGRARRPRASCRGRIGSCASRGTRSRSRSVSSSASRAGRRCARRPNGSTAELRRLQRFAQSSIAPAGRVVPARPSRKGPRGRRPAYTAARGADPRRGGGSPHASSARSPSSASRTWASRRSSTA